MTKSGTKTHECHIPEETGKGSRKRGGGAGASGVCLEHLTLLPLDGKKDGEGSDESDLQK